MTVTLKTPEAGSSDPVRAAIRYRTVTVFVALTQAEKVPVVVWLAFGTDRLTTSPSAAPVTVTVRSVTAPAAVLPKSSVAEPLSVKAYSYLVEFAGEKYLLPLANSSAPFSAVVKSVPSSIFKLAVDAVAVPAFKCNIAVGAIGDVPIYVLPLDQTEITGL